MVKWNQIKKAFGLKVEEPKPEPEPKPTGPVELIETVLSTHFGMIEIIRTEKEGGRVWLRSSLTEQGQKRLDELETIDDTLDFLRTVTPMYEIELERTYIINGEEKNYVAAGKAMAFRHLIDLGLNLLKSKRDADLKGKW